MGKIITSKLVTVERELKKLQLLFDVSQALNTSMNLEEALQLVLKKMGSSDKFLSEDR